jgi:hypothetical protein
VVVGLNLWLVPIWGYYGAIAASITGGLIQVILFKRIQALLYPLSWNLTKVFYFPLGVVLLMIFLELLKVFIGLNELISTSVLVMIVLIAMGLMYHREIKYLIKRAMGLSGSR